MQKILAAYEQLAEKYNELIDDKPHNAWYDRPNTLALFPDVNGKIILDAACGPGKYAEILMERGAMVKGFDISPKMIELAKRRNNNKGEFFVQDLSKPFTMLEDQSCDIVLCALALHYIQDWTPTMLEFNRVLKPGGLLIISIEHPFFEYNYYRARNYFTTEPVQCTWQGFGAPVEINSFRRPLQDCIAPIISNGFYLDKLIEPLPTEKFQEADPKHFAELNTFPGFMCIRAVKKKEE